MWIRKLDDGRHTTVFNQERLPFFHPAPLLAAASYFPNRQKGNFTWINEGTEGKLCNPALKPGHTVRRPLLKYWLASKRIFRIEYTSSVMIKLALRPVSSGGIRDPRRLVFPDPGAREAFRGSGVFSFMTAIFGASGFLITGTVGFSCGYFTF